VGIGDQLIASGLARGAWTRRGRKVAFGSGGRIIWDKHSKEIFLNNPNVCFPGNEARQKLEWIEFHKGSRGYNRQGDGHWIWNMDWRCTPGEIYFTGGELAAGRRQGKGFVVIEPNVVRWKSSAANKDWGAENYQDVADRLIADGCRVIQFVPPDGGTLLTGVKALKTATFRDAVAVLKNAQAYVGAEGGCITPQRP
jgi:ADP-heptose:LPS heptosyltransferase